MTNLGTLIEQLCSKRFALVRDMAANPEQVKDEQIRDLAALQSALAAVELNREGPSVKAAVMGRARPGRRPAAGAFAAFSPRAPVHDRIGRGAP